MDNYCLYSGVIKFAEEKNFRINEIELGWLAGEIVWYGKGIDKTLPSGQQVFYFVVPAKGVLNLYREPVQGIKKIEKDFVCGGTFYKFKRIVKSRPRKIIIDYTPKRELLDSKLIKSFAEAMHLAYHCYAMLENGKCVNFIWGVGEPSDLKYKIFALDTLNTVREFNPKHHVLQELKVGDCISLAASGFRYEYYDGGLSVPNMK